MRGISGPCRTAPLLSASWSTTTASTDTSSPSLTRKPERCAANTQKMHASFSWGAPSLVSVKSNQFKRVLQLFFWQKRLFWSPYHTERKYWSTLCSDEDNDHEERERCSRVHLDAITSDDTGNIYAFRGEIYVTTKHVTLSTLFLHFCAFPDWFSWCDDVFRANLSQVWWKLCF